MTAVRSWTDPVPDDRRTLAPSLIWWAFGLDGKEPRILQPDGPDAGDLFRFTHEQAGILRCWYQIDDQGHFVHRRGVLRRMKGWGKDPLLAVIAAMEFVGPCRFGGWDDEGYPVAVPQNAAWVQIAAVSKDQTRNTMTLFPGLFSSRAIQEYGIDLGKEIIYSAAGGRIEAVTSSPRALEGGRASFVVMNETQHWLPSGEGDRMAEVIARNLAKIRGGSARSLAITNAHNPGENSVAERDFEAWCAIRDGRSRASGFYYDSLEADPRTDLSDRDSLRQGLAEAAGDASWLDLDRLTDTVYDPTTPPSVSRRFYLNQIAESEDAWIAPREWHTCEALESDGLADDDVVTLGFDGSVRDDSTALVACRVSDGLLELLACWEKPEGPAGEGWQVDREAVDAAIFRAFETYDVCGLYADPAQWQDYLDRWHQEFADRVRVKATQARPFEFWTNRVSVMVRALERFYEACVSHELKHSGNPVLSRHVLNARRRDGRAGVMIAKEHPGSPRKIDAAMAAVLAYEARADAVAQGITSEPEVLAGFTFY